jgi:hypothetical protein
MQRSTSARSTLQNVRIRTTDAGFGASGAFKQMLQIIARITARIAPAGDAVRSASFVPFTHQSTCHL